MYRIIRTALGMSRRADVKSGSQTGCAFSANAILEGEMVPFNEKERRIDEFWRLSSVKKGEHRTVEVEAESYETGHTASPVKRAAGPPMHLAIVWFDILYVDGTSLMHGSFLLSVRTLSAERVIKAPTVIGGKSSRRL